MVERLWAWSGEGALPIVVDAASCTGSIAEPGVGVLSEENAERLAKLEILDSVSWAHDRLLPWLEVGEQAGSVTVHPTCATRHMGLAHRLESLAEALADDVHVPTATLPNCSTPTAGTSSPSGSSTTTPCTSSSCCRIRPDARGQGRGNSGFYQVDHYEVQVLDSFGLDGKNNECGGIYTKLSPKVNMCLPPLAWQTYDVDFTNAVRDESGKKVKNARITLKHNGVVIHDDMEITGPTGGHRSDPEGTPGPIKLQGHGNPLQFRNIWIVEHE